MTEDELSEHVAARYRNGRDAKVASRGIVDSSNSSNMDQAQYLKELNLRPSLVLNADYQVRYLCGLNVCRAQYFAIFKYVGEMAFANFYLASPPSPSR